MLSLGVLSLEPLLLALLPSLALLLVLLLLVLLLLVLLWQDVGRSTLLVFKGDSSCKKTTSTMGPGHREQMSAISQTRSIEACVTKVASKGAMLVLYSLRAVLLKAFVVAYCWSVLASDHVAAVQFTVARKFNNVTTILHSRRARMASI